MRTHEDASISGLDVEAIVEIVTDAPVLAAVLYGSYARGEQRPGSDIDVAVEFDESLSSTERTRARLALIERLGTALGTDDVDVTPLSKASAELKREILEDGICLYGSVDEDVPEETTGHDERLEDFDELLAELERVV
jgi:predicted nucleotidyltransferase